MRAELPRREPEMVRAWQAGDLYQKLRRARAGAPRYVLHDGPPYANGAIHLGHAVNKLLKDIIVKSRQLEGMDADYVPGWDCHGLPIENQIEKKFGRALPRAEVIAKSRAFAAEQVELQKRDFERMGVLGDWHHPYLTMAPGNEAEEIRAFGRILARGFVYRGLKPVYWCFDCGSSLAEFEIEYAEHTSTAIDVAFECAEPEKLAAAFGLARLEGAAFAVIWTTTAWTLPANQALNLNAKLTYALVQTPRGLLLLAEARVADCLQRYGISGTILARTTGERLAGLRFHHPLSKAHSGYARSAPVYLADYATDTDGTGIVHCAPAYGAEDFLSATAHGMAHADILNPVQANGVYAPDLPLFAGQHIWRATEAVLQALRDTDALLAQSKLQHSYPHCWRHRSPVISRAAAQWFIRMDAGEGVFTDPAQKPAKTLRQMALEAIEQTAFYPANGQARLRDMIAQRPDWCISRQRAWGVPLAVFLHKQSGQPHPRTPEFLARAADLVERGGVEAWETLEPKDWLGEEAALYEKSRDILDVWFDSGTTHEHVLKKSHAAQGAWPADLYLEGHDQHRGWFHSSLLTACALYGRAPYKAILTHGFTIDAQGRKMSKSLGNGIEPKEFFAQYGAEIARLWVASADYSGDIALDKAIIERLVEAYRRVRNTLRFLLANTADFAPINAPPLAQWPEIDRTALANARALQAQILAHYRAYEFHPIAAKVLLYCSEELGGFYLDVLKDRLYTCAATSPARRAAQAALWHILNALLRWVAPYLSFTAEEIWALPEMRARRSEPENASIFTQTYWDFAGAPEDAAAETALLTRWQRLRELRNQANRTIEKEREAGRIGSSLQAELTIRASASDHALLESLGEEAKFLFITSAARLESGGAETAITALPSPHNKCPRCWHWREDTARNAAHPGLCQRCESNLYGSGETRRYV